MVELKLLLVADPESYWTAKYIERVLVSRNVSVTLAGHDMYRRMKGSRYSNLYSANSIHGIGGSLHSVVSRVRGLRGIVSLITLLRAVRVAGPFDVVHVHMVKPMSARLGCLVKLLGYASKLIYSFWGSDLLRSSKFTRLQLRYCAKYADAVTYGGPVMESRLRNILGNRFTDVAKLLFFGVEGLDKIDSLEISESRSDAKLAFGLPADKLVLAIGYNGREEQQHLLSNDQNLWMALGGVT